jgi:hypothetical protein
MFVKENYPSKNLVEKLMRGGVPQEMLQKYLERRENS